MRGRREREGKGNLRGQRNARGARRGRERNAFQETIIFLCFFLNIHRASVKILVGQSSKHVNHSLNTLIRLVEINITVIRLVEINITLLSACSASLATTEQRITFKIAVITLKALHGAAPSYINDLIKTYTPGRLLRSSNQFLLSTSKFNLMVAGLLLLLHLLFGMHFHSNLDLVIPFLLLNLSSRLGFLKLVMMVSYRMMMFL